MSTAIQRRLPIGAELVVGGVHFRVWAPIRRHVEVVFDESRAVPLEREAGGYFSGFADSAGSGMRYRFRLDQSARLVPDPASRFQPEGPHGPSQVIDPFAHHWNDADWKGRPLKGQVIYETHIGTLTAEGTWRAAHEVLPALAYDGITTLEIMPVAEFPGAFGWGYDGTALFAPTHLYGTPDDFRGFIEAAHRLKLAVILDVVYNHLGPEGNYLKEFSSAYFTERYKNEWGEAINFDGPDSSAVREFFIANAVYWIQEFHLDGLRLDATQQIFDNSLRHILRAINSEARKAAGPRSIVVIAENERQNPRFVRSLEEDGYGLDALWNDDFHHSAQVAVTGRNEAYYSDYCGSPQELISIAKWGFLYQGQYSTWQRQRRGFNSFGLEPACFVNYLQNHDQIANSAYGCRLHQLTSPGRYKAITALLMLLPGTPMLFQGQEYAASAPFLYFADHQKELASLVEEGRADFLAQFQGIARSHTEFVMGRPQERGTFEQCKLNREERKKNAHIVALHRDLMELRRDDPVFSTQSSNCIQGAVLGPEAFLLRFFSDGYGDRLIVVNLGRDLLLRPAPEPLLAPSDGTYWDMLWSSEDPRYRGSGRPPMRKAGTWNIPGHCLAVMYETNGY
jgi:maltooligosyltrehalose trehalohydrolase